MQNLYIGPYELGQRFKHTPRESEAFVHRTIADPHYWHSEFHCTEHEQLLACR